MKGQDYYSVLGIPADASQAEIKAAYRVQIKRHHPDMNPGDPGATRRSRKINKAYETLSDPALRLAFDIETLATQDGLCRRGEHPDSHTQPPGRRATTPTGEAGATSPGTGTDRRQGQSRHAFISLLGGMGSALLVGIARLVEFLSIPLSMIGIGTVLVALGGYMTASAAMDFILIALTGVPATAVGLLLLIVIHEGWPAILGVLVTVAGVGLALYGALMTLSTAPIPVLMTLLGIMVFCVAVRVGLVHSSFTSRRVRIVT